MEGWKHTSEWIVLRHEGQISDVKTFDKCLREKEVHDLAAGRPINQEMDHG